MVFGNGGCQTTGPRVSTNFVLTAVNGTGPERTSKKRTYGITILPRSIL